jgi:hypothetical protein
MKQGIYNHSHSTTCQGKNVPPVITCRQVIKNENRKIYQRLTYASQYQGLGWLNTWQLGSNKPEITLQCTLEKLVSDLLVGSKPPFLPNTCDPLRH